MKAKSESTGDPPSAVLNRVEAHLLKDDGSIPNNPKLPLLIYERALKLPDTDPASVIEQLFSANCWGGTWRNGIYSYHHYHSTAHEVLAVYCGHAKVQLGGPKGISFTIQRGDVLLLPAGTGHKKLGSSNDFAVVGGYPRGQDWDMCYGKAGERPQTDENIARVALPKADPIFGRQGPLMQHWSA